MNNIVLEVLLLLEYFSIDFWRPIVISFIEI